MIREGSQWVVCGTSPLRCRLDPETLKSIKGSYSLMDWGHGQIVPEFTVLEHNPHAQNPPKRS
jgi:hypothetical protein